MGAVRPVGSRRLAREEKDGEGRGGERRGREERRCGRVANGKGMKFLPALAVRRRYRARSSTVVTPLLLRTECTCTSERRCDEKLDRETGTGMGDREA